MIAKVRVTLKPGLLDAQGKAVKQALESLGFRGVQDVRMGKYIEVELAQAKADAAKREVERMCEKLLANPVIERCQIELSGGRS